MPISANAPDIKTLEGSAKGAGTVSESGAFCGCGRCAPKFMVAVLAMWLCEDSMNQKLPETTRFTKGTTDARPSQ